LPQQPAQGSYKPKGPVVGTCGICGKAYRSKKYVEDHRITHKIKGNLFKKILKIGVYNENPVFVIHETCSSL